eukprot:4191231-Amphidinium_carterae.1
MFERVLSGFAIPLSILRMCSWCGLASDSHHDSTLGGFREGAVLSVYDPAPALKQVDMFWGPTWSNEDLPASAPELVLEVVRLHGSRVRVHKAYDGAF